MDLGLSQEQEMLKTMARDFLTAECPASFVKTMSEDKNGYTPELWKKMAELGWMGIVLPEEYGGMAMNYLDLVILLEEMGRAGLLGPFFSTVVLAGYTIMEAGSKEQKQELLTAIAKGNLIIALALTEPNAGYDAASVTVKAAPSGSDYVINGTKLFVSDANVAQQVICVARTQPGANPEQGVTLFVVDAASPGVTITPLKTIAGDKQCEVTFENVKVPAKNILGEVNKGWPVIEKVLQKATVGISAYMFGGMQRAFEMSIDYAKERVQFGRPIGTKQAIQFYLADMATDVSSSKDTLHEAAWTVSEGLKDSARKASVAKAWISDAAFRVTRMAIQIHGALGFTMDHDVHIYFKRAAMGQPLFGNSDWHRGIVAKESGF